MDRFLFDSDPEAFLKRIQEALDQDHVAEVIPRREYESGPGPFGGRIHFSVARYLRRRLRQLWSALGFAKAA